MGMGDDLSGAGSLLLYMRPRTACCASVSSLYVHCNRAPALFPQVHAAGVEPGEDLSLRQQLRQMEGRRAAAERCRLVRLVRLASTATCSSSYLHMSLLITQLQVLLCAGWRVVSRLRDRAALG